MLFQGRCQGAAFWKCLLAPACSCWKVPYKHDTVYHRFPWLIPLWSHKKNLKKNCHDIACFCCLCRDAKAMYSCEAEHSHELSFPQGAHFSNGEANISCFSRRLLCCRSAPNITHASLRRMIGLWTVYTDSLVCPGSTQPHLANSPCCAEA